MDVDVDLARIERDEERRDRMAVALHEVGIGRAHGAEEQLVPHRPAVDEEELHEPVAAAEGRQAGEALQPHALAARVDGNRVLAEVARPSPAPAGRAAPRRRRRGKIERRPVAAGEGEANLRVGHGETLDAPR